MPTYLKFDIAGDDRVRELLRWLAANAIEPTEALDAIADDFLRVQQRRFSEASAIWKPLKPISALRKAARGRSTAPLVGGTLEESLTHAGARYAVRREAKSSITLGTREPTAHLHRDGTRRGLPKRPPVAISAEDARRWRDIFADHLLAGRHGL